MPIKIQSDANFRAELLTLEGLIEYSTDLLIFLSPTRLDSLTFSWISPTNRKFQERILYRDIYNDEDGLFAYSAVIYPVFTAGVSGDVGQVIVSFRNGDTFSPLVKMPVNKSLLPEQTTMPVSLYDEIGADLIELHAADEALQTQIDEALENGHTHVEMDITDLDKYTQAQVDTFLDGKADLVAGKIPVSQLPAYVDDVLEYANYAAFPVTGEESKIYIDKEEDDTYRWSGTAYIKISDVLSAADVKSLYEQNSNTNAFTDALANKLNTIEEGAEVNVVDRVNGQVGTVLLKTDNVAEGTTNKYFTEQRVTDSAAIASVLSELATHEADTTNPHVVTAEQVGLGNVENTTDLDKPISTATQTALDDKADLIDGKIPIIQLPSFDGSYLEAATYADLPATGEAGTVYVVLNDETDLNTSSIYRWTGSAYVIINDAMSAADIKSLYESNADTNALTNALLAEIQANTLKDGITAQQEADILANNDKISYTDAAAVALNTAKLSADANATNQGNTFNGADELVKLNSSGQLPAIDGSLLTGLEIDGTTVTVSDTAPTSPSNGDLWWDSVDGDLKVFYVDVWVDASVQAEPLSSTDDLGEGSVNLYYTEARVSANTDVVANTAKVSYDDAAAVALNTTHRGQTDNPHVVTKEQLTLGNVDNTSDLDKPISTLTQTALDSKADLVGGLIPSSQLPSFVDDVLEYADEASFPATGEAGKIYIALDTNETFRWADTVYVQIGDILSAADIKSLYESNANTNAFTDTYKDEVDANTLKVGITTQQASDITANNAKISYDDAAAVALNTAKVGITPTQATNISENTTHSSSDGKDHSDVVANNAKISYTDSAVVAAHTTKLDEITPNSLLPLSGTWNGDSYSTAINPEGRLTTENVGDRSIAFGEGVTASSVGSIAIGDDAVASNTQAIALGENAIASGAYSIALGRSTEAAAIRSLNIGGFTSTVIVTADYSIQLGDPGEVNLTEPDIFRVWTHELLNRSTGKIPEDRIPTLLTTNVTEGTNLYYTDARADARIAAATTDDVDEGATNLYYTDARADARVALAIDAAPAALDTLNELAAALGDDPNFATTIATQLGNKYDASNPDGFISNLVGFSTTDLAEGTNLYYTEGRVSANTDVAANTAKVGITTEQATAITLNTAKVGYTDALVSANTNVTANTIHRDSDGKQHSDVVINNAKVGYTDELVAASPSVSANVIKLATIEEGAQVNVPETLTTLSLTTNILTYTDEDGVDTDIDLSLYLDDTNLARITSGVYNAPTQELIFTRDDASTFTIDASMFFDDTNLVTSINGEAGVVVLDTDDINEGALNLYYTEARVSANSDVAANTAKTGITAQQAADIVTNSAHITDTTGAHTSTAISYDNTISGLTATNVKGAVDEISELVDGIETLLAAI